MDIVTNQIIIGISIHSLRMEGDLVHLPGSVLTSISIHSLRMEGDLDTPIFTDPADMISIHSLRMEGDPGVL